MKARNLGYWISTSLVALAFAFAGVMDLAGAPQVVAGITQLGYPAYLAGLLGIWKVLGALAVLAPGTPRLKEWAYAGMFFDLTGAAYSHAASGDAVGHIVTPLVLLALVAASWASRSQGRALPAVATTPPAASLRSAPHADLLGAKG